MLLFTGVISCFQLYKNIISVEKYGHNKLRSPVSISNYTHRAASALDYSLSAAITIRL